MRRRSIILAKKTISLVLILQLAIPPHFVRAMDSDDEEIPPPPPLSLLNDPRLLNATASERAPDAPSTSSSATATSSSASSSSSALSGAMLDADVAAAASSKIRAISPLSQKLKALYASQDTLPKLIDDERLPEHHLSTHYVNLQVLLKEEDGQGYDRVVGEKAPIDPNDIFKEVDKDHPEVSRILFLGGAGVGKTTLLHYLSYRWAQEGQEGLWGGKFDYVLRVRLKELLDEGWAKYYNGRDALQRDPLSCFLHHCLKVQSPRLDISAQDISGIENKDRVLLLLDGYDEIAHLARNNRDYKTVMEGVFGYKHVLMSSRPNALGSDISAKFERRIETRGFDGGQIRHYIDLHFKVSEEDSSASAPKESTLGKNLKHFLYRNTHVMEMCTIPINTALMCLIWGDPKTRGKLGGLADFNIGQLYHEVIVWLGKRYFDKFEQGEEEVTPKEIFRSNEVRFLRKVAHDSFVETGKLVTSRVVQDNMDLYNLGKVGLRKVIKYGLLKPEGEGREVTELNHQFVHLTFQEYLTAYYLKEHLLSGDSVQKTAQFIGEHRNEPKYLMTLKFLAGMVSGEEERGAPVAASASRAPSPLLTRFWEAVTCNVDGILELGLETKVKLLIHLLAQGTVEGAFNPRIPNLQKIIDFVDSVILRDITPWGEHIIQSGYLSPKTVGCLKGIMAQALSKSPSGLLEQGKRSAPAADAASSSSTAAAPASVSASASPSLKMNAEQKRAQGVEIRKLKTAMEVVTSLMNRHELREEGDTYEESRHVLFNSLMALVTSHKNRHVKKLGLQKLYQIMDQMIPEASAKACLSTIIPFLINSNLAKAVCDLLITIIKVKPGLTGEALSLLKPLLTSDNEDTRSSAAESLGEVVKRMPVVATEIFCLLKPLLSDGNINVRSAAATSLGEVVKAVPRVAIEALNLLKPLLSDDSAWVRLTATRSLGEVVKRIPATEAFGLLMPLLTGDNHDVGSSAAEILGEVVKGAPGVVVEFFDLFKHLLFDAEEPVKVAVVKSFGEVVKGSPAVAGEAFNLLKPLLSDDDARVRHRATRSLREVVVDNSERFTGTKCFEEMIVKVAPEVALEVFGLLKPLLSNDDERVRFTVASSLGEIVKAVPAVAFEVFDLLKLLLSDDDKHVRRHAASSLGEVVKAAPERAAEAFGLLTPLLSDGEYNVRSAAIKSFGEVVKAAPELAVKSFGMLKPLLSDRQNSIRGVVAMILREVVKAAPELADEAFGLLKPLLSDGNITVRGVAAMSLGEVVGGAPEVALEFFSLLKPLLSDNNPNGRKFAIKSLEVVVKSTPEVVIKVLGLLKPHLVAAGEVLLRHYAAESLGKMLKVASFDTLARMLTDDVPQVREQSASALLEKLKDPLEVDKLVYTHTLTLLQIVKATKGADETKELSLAAQNVLKHLAGQMDVAWLTDRVYQLPQSPETQSFLKDVCHKILSDGEISLLERDFIIKSITRGLTTTLTRSGNIILEEQTYPLSEASQPYLAEIGRAALSLKGDVLVVPYRNHAPLFSNSGMALRKAASDIENMRSLVNTKEILEYQGGMFTCLSAQTSGQSSETFLLFEKRSHFGDRVVYKLNPQGKLLVHQESHPERTDRAFREAVFGPLDASTYRAISVVMNEDKAIEIEKDVLHSQEQEEVEREETSISFDDFSRQLNEWCIREASRPQSSSAPPPSVENRILTYDVAKMDLLDATDEERQRMKQQSVLDHARVSDKANITQGFAKLAQRSPVLHAYCKTFYWTMLNLCGAYRALSTDVVAANLSYEVSTSRTLMGKGVGKVGKFLPMIGGVIGALDDIVQTIADTVKQNGMMNNAKSMTKIIQAKLGFEEDIGLAISQVALAITLAKEEEILKPALPEASREMPQLTRIKKWIADRIAAIKDKVLPSIELHDKDDAVAQLALQDVALTMAYLFTHYETILADEAPLDHQLAAIIRERGLERLLGEVGRVAPESASPSSSASVSSSVSASRGNPSMQIASASQGPANHNVPVQSHKKKPEGSKCVMQ